MASRHGPLGHGSLQLTSSLVMQLDPLEDVTVPDRLISEARLQSMLEQQSPRFIPLARAPPHAPMSADNPLTPADPVTGETLGQAACVPPPVPHTGSAGMRT